MVRIRFVFNACDIGKCFNVTLDALFIVVNMIALTKSLCYAMILTGEVERYFTVADFGKNKMCPCVMETVLFLSLFMLPTLESQILGNVNTCHGKI